MTPTLPVLSATLRPNADEYRERLVVVHEGDRDVMVRWRLGRAEPWRCSACGPLRTADCAHTFAAGLVLAEQLLGLSRVRELRPEDTRSHEQETDR